MGTTGRKVMTRFLSNSGVWALSALALAACAGSAPRSGAATGTPPEPSTAELEALYGARTDSARMRFTKADVRFVTGMIAHHAQAIAMGRLAPGNEAAPSVQTLAARIISAQEDEISRMRQWIVDRGQLLPYVIIRGTDLIVHGAEHALHMPGMLTPEQMAELERARGAAFDRLFLTYMIQHHQGAVTMVRELFATDGAAQDEAVFKLASDVHVDQLTEIQRMERMLDALPEGSGGGGR